MSDTAIEIEGLGELTNSLKNFANQYPDKAAELLVKQARGLRKEVVKKIKNETDSPAKSKQSLAKVGSYKISNVQGYGDQQYVEVSARSKHFHLIEQGHMQMIPFRRVYKKDNKVVRRLKLSRGGEITGFTLGYHIMDQVTDNGRVKIPAEFADAVNKLLNEEGL